MNRLRLKIARWLAVPAAAGAAGCAQPGDDPAAPPPEPQSQPEVADQAKRPRARPRARSFLVARVRAGRSLVLRSRPRGKIVATVGSHTEFGDRTHLGVVRRLRNWVGVTTARLPNGRLGWFRAGTRAVDFNRTRTAVDVDLSARRLEVRRGDRVLDRAQVGIGRPGSPTPRGRFAITDKLRGARFSAVYGRFILALSGRQRRTPRGWTGGDRLAIHGTNTPARVGERTSAGCVVADDQALARIIDDVQPGTPVVIRE